jgi:hypothetical protein
MNMAKTYTLTGPIILENLSNTDALGFAAAVINAIPSYSMGTASLNIRAQGPAGGTSTITGESTEELQASLAKVKDEPAPSGPEDITYDVRGAVALVGLSLEDGIQVIEAAMNAIPGDSLVFAGMLAQESGSA